MKAITTITGLFLFFSALTQVRIPFVVNFENHPSGTYTTAMAKEDFPPLLSDYDYWYYGMEQGRSEIVEENGNKSLRVKYPAGCVGPHETPTGCGVQIRWKLPEMADTMWVSYRIKFESGFEFVQGGKLPGLCGGKCYTGGEVPPQGDGWSARIMWRTDGAVVQYLYFTEQAGIYGDDMKWELDGTQRRFIPGTWHSVVTQIVLNTVPKGTSHGEKNGIVRSWFDGKQSLEVDTLRLVDFEDQSIDVFYFSTFHGGNDSTWVPTKDCYVRYDDFRIFKNPPKFIKY
jgi:hypothetical protein